MAADDPLLPYYGDDPQKEASNRENERNYYDALIMLQMTRTVLQQSVEENQQLKAIHAELLEAAQQVADRLERLADLNKEAGYHPNAATNLEMAGVLRTAIAKTPPEQQSTRVPSVHKPEQNNGIMAVNYEERYLTLLQEAERELGESHPALTYPLVALGDEYSSRLHRRVEAEQLYTRAIAIWEQHDPDNRRIAQPLNNLGILYATQDRFAEAVPLIERALQIEEKYDAIEPHTEKKSFAIEEPLYAPLTTLRYVYLMGGEWEQVKEIHQRIERIADKYQDNPDSLRGMYPGKMLRINFGIDPYGEAKSVYQQTLKEHNLENWQETKRQMQGAVEILAGKSTEVNWQRLSAFGLSDAIAHDSITHNVERNAKKDIEPER